MTNKKTGQGISSLTELEGAALGLVWRNGNCSAYSVMREFATSASSSWSASAGAVYPALRRLERLGLIVGTTNKGKRALATTAHGLAALRHWLAIRPEIARATSDPVRSRIFFLDVLDDPKEQTELLVAAENETRHALKERQRDLERSAVGDPVRLASMGSVFELKARLGWLRWAKKEIAG
jgi:DNA-binding PadR family transcriptional regulator